MLLTPDRILKARQFLQLSISKEWIEQGHNASGKTLEELEIVYVEEGGKAIFRGLGSKVMAIHDKGVKPKRIRISWAKWKVVGFTWSKIIKPNMTNTARYRFLWFTWLKWKKEGMPTRNSYQYSKNGRRTDWTTNSVFDEATQDLLAEQLDLAPLLEQQLFSSIDRLLAA